MTGYTAAVEEGEATFESFVWKCASAFFAEHNIDVEGDRETRCLEKAVEDARERLRTLQSWTRGDWEAFHAEELDRLKDYEASSTESTRQKLARYDAMLERVKSWEPPTEKHANLKAFMLEQLTDSRDFINVDPGSNRYVERFQEIPLDHFIEDRVLSAKEDVSYHERKLFEHRDRVMERQRWFSQLERSVPRPGKEEKSHEEK